MKNTKLFYNTYLLFKILISGSGGLFQALGMERRCEISSGYGEKEFQAPLASLRQLHLSYSSRWLTYYPQGQQGHQIIHLNFLTWNDPACLAGPGQLCLPARHSPYCLPGFLFHQVCPLPCTLPLLPVTAKPAFAALMPSTSILTLVVFLPHPSQNQITQDTSFILTTWPMTSLLSILST